MSKSKEDPAELVVRPSAPLANIDDMFADAAGEGLEKVGADEIVLPRLAMLQPTSPLSSEEGYRPGDLVNSVSGYNFSKTLRFYPLMFWSSRIHWENPEPGSAIECQARDGEHGSKKDEAHAGGHCVDCQFSKWTERPDKNEPPLCTRFKNVLIMPIGHDDAPPMVLSAKRTGEKPINQMLSAASMMRKNGKPVPFYACAWQITTDKVSNDKGTFFVPKFTQGEIISDPALFMQLREIYATMKTAQEHLVVPQDGGYEGEATHTGDY